MSEPNRQAIRRVTPLAKRIAAEQGLDLDDLSGIGHGGKINTQDLKNIPVKQAAQVQADPYIQAAHDPGYVQIVSGQIDGVPQLAQVPVLAPAGQMTMPAAAQFDSFGQMTRIHDPYAQAAPYIQTAQGQMMPAPSPLQADAYTQAAQVPDPAQAPVQADPYAQAAQSAVMPMQQPAQADAFAQGAQNPAMVQQAQQQPQMNPYAQPGQIPPSAQPAQAAIDPYARAAQTAQAVQYARQAPDPAAAPQPHIYTAEKEIAGIIRMSDTRYRTAARTASSSAQTAAITQHVETDITEMAMTRGSIPLTAFYIKAIALGLRSSAKFGLRLANGGEAYIVIDGANVGLWLDVGDSVVTPVIKYADLKSVGDIATETAALTEKAIRGGLSEDDISGGAITLNDKSGSGVYAFTPIINQPEAAILGVGGVYQRLAMTNRGIENKQYIMLSLTFDYRIVNGTEAEDFQLRLKELLENPKALL